MKIEKLKLKDIKPYPHNPKTHPRTQIDALARSIETFGFRVPVMVDGENTLVAGHGRYLAAMQLKMAQIPAIRATDLTPEQIKAYRVADNRIPEMNAWDWQAMARDFTLEEFSALTADTGMSEDDLNRFMDAAHQPLPPDEAQAAADQAAQPMTDFERQMQEPVNPKMAIVPQYCEDYEAFIIVCKNSIDETYMREALGLSDLAQSYTDSKIKRPNILNVEQFKQKWESRS